jgi:hypothetical protein
MVALAFLVALAPSPAHADVRLFDVATGEASTVVDDDASLRAWTSDGAGLLLGKNGGLLQLDLATGKFTPHPLPVGSTGPSGQRIEYDFGRFVLRGADGRLLVAHETGISFEDPDVAWSPDGRWVALTLLFDLWVLDTATGAVVVHHDDRETALTAQAFAPDGSALVVGQRRRAARIDLPSGRTTTLLRVRGTNEYPGAAWSSRGQIAITRNRRIAVIGLPGIRVDTDALRPALWSADGRLLRVIISRAADACSYPQEGVGVAAPGGTTRVLVRPGPRELRAALWSPIGAQLAVDRGRDHTQQRGKRRPWPRRIARDYEMLTARANAAVRRIVLRAARLLRRGEGRETVLSRVRLDHAAVANRFREAGDTAVRQALANELDRWLLAAGFEPIEALDEITC